MTNITIYHNKGVHWRDKVGPDTERVPAREVLGVATRSCDFSVHVRFRSGITHVEKWASRELMDRRERELLTHMQIVKLQEELRYLQGRL